MTMLDTHLEQIALCSSTIEELPFPAPKIFTNAILRTNDITALIRDTETHERALYTTPAVESKPGGGFDESTSRRGTTYNVKTSSQVTQKTYQLPRRNKLISAALGGDLAQQIQRQNGGARGRSEVDVDLLFEGAEKLCAIYPISGAAEKIAALRQRHKAVKTSIDRYEVLVAEQATQLGRLSRSRSFGRNEVDDGVANPPRQLGQGADNPYTEDDLRRDEEGIKELERKKRTLEERVSGMEKDLGGLMR